MYKLSRKLRKNREARGEEFKVVISTVLKLLTVVSWQEKLIGDEEGIERKENISRV